MHETAGKNAGHFYACISSFKNTNESNHRRWLAYSDSPSYYHIVTLQISLCFPP